MSSIRKLGLALGCLALACDRPQVNRTVALESASLATDATPAPAPGAFRTVEVPEDRPAYIIEGPKEHPILFLPGMCVHPAGYVQSFPRAASQHGTMLGLQGDVPCGGEMRSWSMDLAAIDRRADAAFEAAGLGTPRDVTVIGYSQGADRAEALAARFPEKYARAILIASPVTPGPAKLRRAKAVVTMAGDHDISRERMRTSAEALKRAKVPATYFLIPHTYHGAMGDDPEATMRPALDFVFQHD